MSEPKYIDAYELNKVKFHPLPYTHITPTDADAESYKRGWNDAIDAIVSEAPAADVEPRWIPCSECKRRCEKWENLETSQVNDLEA